MYPQIFEKLVSEIPIQLNKAPGIFGCRFLKFNNFRVFQKISAEIAEPSVSVLKAPEISGRFVLYASLTG